MTARHATRDALLTYIRADSEPRPVIQIRKYMLRMHGISHGATRTALWRLCQTGEIVRTEIGFYQIGGAL